MEGACWVWEVRVSPVLVCTTTSSVSRGGEAEGGKERRIEHLPFSNELTRCNTCVESSPSNGRKRREQKKR